MEDSPFLYAFIRILLLGVVFQYSILRDFMMVFSFTLPTR